MKIETRIEKYNFPLHGSAQRAANALTEIGVKNAHDVGMGCAVVLEITDTEQVNKVSDIAMIYGGHADNDEVTAFDLTKLNEVSL